MQDAASSAASSAATQSCSGPAVAAQVAISDWDAFNIWASQNLGQGYSLVSEEGVFIDRVTRWCFNGFKAGRATLPATSWWAKLPAIAWHCVNTVTGRMLYTDSESDMANMRDSIAKFWRITPLCAMPISPIADAAGAHNALPLLTLGKQLQQNLKNAAASRADIDASPSAVARPANLIIVSAFFDDALAYFARNIVSGLPAGTAALGRYPSDSYWSAAKLLRSADWQLSALNDWQHGGIGIWNPDSPCHSAWKDFLSKCDVNGLVPVWSYGRDGTSLWWDLTVSAK